MTKYNETDIVEVSGEPGMVVSIIREDTEWYPDPDDEDEFYEIEASEEAPVYLVAHEEETVPYTEEQISGEGTWDEVDEDMDMDEIDDAADESELSEVYYKCDNPHDFDEFMNTLYELGKLSDEELEAELASPAVDLPGARTAGIGFATDPPGWTRSSYLKAWRTFRGKWRVCYPRMIRHFGPRMARRWCS